MPEGDTIFLVAKALRAELLDRPLLRAATRREGELRALAGARITTIATQGKHLLLESERLALRVHLGLHGSWRVHEPDDPVLARSAPPSLLLVTAERAFACRSAREVEVGPPERVRRGRWAEPGPDLLAASLDLEEILARAQDRAGTVSELLLDQRVAAGIGNVYRCEVLFVAGLDPFAPSAGLDDEAIAGLYRIARRLMTANLASLDRATTGERGPRGEDRLFVYGRQGRACRSCGGAVRMRKAGAEGERTTWWCPRCQPARR